VLNLITHLPKCCELLLRCSAHRGAIGDKVAVKGAEEGLRALSLGLFANNDQV
jgi:hypothetical protein